VTSPPQKPDGGMLLERFRRYLTAQNLPVTHQRLQIAETVFFSDRHLSVGDIVLQLRGKGERVGTATVYRTLELLRAAALVEEHDFGERLRRYEPMLAYSHHEHLICTECGAVIEFASERIERMKALIAEEHGFRPRHHRLEIYGLCQQCQHRDAAALRPMNVSTKVVSDD